MREASFGEVLLLSDVAPPTEGISGITWRPIEPLRSRADYSRFVLRSLADHIATTHALCVQWDGFVLRGEAWNHAFLDYDYIGAVWPQFDDGYNVGNGGFSLRSRRLLEACGDLSFDPEWPEDLVIGRACRPELERRGLRFAPETVARQFSYERTSPQGHEFGFHGAFNLVHYLSKADALELFRNLEPNVLASGERRELFWWALSHGRVRLARAMLPRSI